MPGSNAGTGQPMRFICGKCRKNEYKRHRWNNPHTGLDVYAFHTTGRKRFRPNYNRGGGRVDVNWVYEYECVAPRCGHVGWSRHIDVARDWIREFGEVVDATSKSTG